MKCNLVHLHHCFSIGFHYGPVLYWMMPFPYQYPIQTHDSYLSLCFSCKIHCHTCHTHMIDMRCIQANDKMITLLKPDCTVAEKGHHKDDYIVYCVRNNISMGVWSGPRDKYVRAPTYYIWAPTCYAGPETIMSGPRLIMPEPLLMSGPWDNYVGAPFLELYRMKNPEWSQIVIMSCIITLW